MKGGDAVSFEVDGVEAETEKAILVEIEGEKVWIPKGEIAEESEVWSKKNGKGTLIISEWIAREKGLV